MTRIYLSAPDVTDLERQALIDAFDSGWVAPVGPHLTEFEQHMCHRIGWPGAVALSSGTAALHLAMLEVGVQPGDTVLCSTFTFVATANAITYCGATPVFVDSDSESWNMSPALLREALDALAAEGVRPAAVIMVDLYGQCADADAIAGICAQSGIALIEDAAEALGATYRGRPAGTLGDLGVFSFNGNKIITTSGGGMLVTPSTEMADRARHLATQAREPAVHYEHARIGYNYRLSNLSAAMGTAQLARLDDIMTRRHHINQRYREALGHVHGLEFMPVPDWSGWNGWLTCVTFTTTSRRDAVIAALDSADIESRPLWKPMHLQPAYAGTRAFVDGTSEDLFTRGLCLPSSGALTDADIDLVIETLLDALG